MTPPRAGCKVAALPEHEAKTSLAGCVQSNLHLLQSIFWVAQGAYLFLSQLLCKTSTDYYFAFLTIC